LCYINYKLFLIYTKSYNKAKNLSKQAMTQSTLTNLKETKLPLNNFPLDNPFTVEQILDEDWFPSDQ